MFDLVLITPEHKFRFDIFLKNKVYKKLMNFYRKKNKISSVHVKDKSCNSLKAQQLYQKGTLQHRYFSVNIPNILGTVFL